MGSRDGPYHQTLSRRMSCPSNCSPRNSTCRWKLSSLNELTPAPIRGWRETKERSWGKRNQTSRKKTNKQPQQKNDPTRPIKKWDRETYSSSHFLSTKFAPAFSTSSTGRQWCRTKWLLWCLYVSCFLLLVPRARLLASSFVASGSLPSHLEQHKKDNSTCVKSNKNIYDHW